MKRDPTQTALERAVRDDPQNPAPWAALADWTAERDGPENAAHVRLVASMVQHEYPAAVDETVADAQRWLLTVLTGDWRAGEEARNQLRRSNGGRKVRTLRVLDLWHCCIQARTRPYGILSGGTVANCYGHKSWQTIALAVRRPNGMYRIASAMQSAAKGASLFTPFGLTARSSAADFHRWATRRPHVVTA